MSPLPTILLRRPLPLSLSHSSLPTLLRRASTGLPVPPPPSPALQPNPSTRKDLQQAPNHAGTWSTSQNPKPQAFNNPRFEQTNWDLQPSGLAGIAMVAEDPVRLVEGRRSSCDGGGGPLGHPRVFINLDKPGPKACGYCGIRFEQAQHH